MIRFTTLNSTYELDHDAKTWKRTATSGASDPEASLRTEEGELWGHTRVEVGHPVEIYGPPLDSGNLRLITTTLVTKVEPITTADLWWRPDLGDIYGEPT